MEEPSHRAIRSGVVSIHHNILNDGRRITVREYGNGSIRIQVAGGPYMVDELYLNNPPRLTLIRLRKRGKEQ